MSTAVQAATAFSKAVSGRFDDLTFKISPDEDACYDLDNNIMYLPGLPGEGFSPEVQNLLRCFLAHESWERGKTTWPFNDAFLGRAHPGLKQLVNALNDARIDLEGLAEFPGAGINVRAVRKEFAQEWLKEEGRGATYTDVACAIVYLAEEILDYDQVVESAPEALREILAEEEAFFCWQMQDALWSEEEIIRACIAFDDRNRYRLDFSEEWGANEALLKRIARALRERVDEWEGTQDIPYTYDDSLDHQFVLRASPSVPDPDTERAAEVLSQTLRNVLVAPHPQQVRKQKSGLLDPRRLPQLMCAQADVFKERFKRPGEDVAIAISCDFSGSMHFSPDNKKSPRKAASLAFFLCAFGEALERQEIPWMVEAWRGSRRELKNPSPRIVRLDGIDYIQIKPFSERLSPQVRDRFRTSAFDSSSPMGEGVLHAAQQLHRRPERRKILFVVTDGEPKISPSAEFSPLIDPLVPETREYHWGQAALSAYQAFCKRSVEKVEESGVEVIGVGLWPYEELSEWFSKYVHISHPEDLYRGAHTELLNHLTHRRTL